MSHNNDFISFNQIITDFKLLDLLNVSYLQRFVIFSLSCEKHRKIYFLSVECSELDWKYFLLWKLWIIMRWTGLKSYYRLDSVPVVFILTSSDYTRKFIEMFLLDLLHLTDKVYKTSWSVVWVVMRCWW